MKISVFGLGYAGVITAACFCHEGYDVVGVDISDSKIDLINSGNSPIAEEKVDVFIREAVEQGRLVATKDAQSAVAATEMSFVCVGTPSCSDGTLDMRYVETVIREIGEALRYRTEHFTIVVRSTLLPGFLHGKVIPLIEKACRRKSGDGFNVLFHPEFLREGSSIEDFYNPAKIVIGTDSEAAATPLLSLYGDTFEAPRIVCGVEEAEMVKYCDNLFHALKITFANEIGEFCHASDINGSTVMKFFCKDKKLNISSKYLMPGFAFGGSCLPKDLRAFVAAARKKNLNLPTLENILVSNNKQIDRVLRIILAHSQKKIGFYGISFKKGTDDLRESPYVELAERLLGKGYNLSIYDEKVQVSRLIGGNLSFVESHLPHLAHSISNDIDVLDDMPLLVLNHLADSADIRRWLNQGKHIIDLTGRDDFKHRSKFEHII
jgi:GDP-mannose 6-dehydrogenase